MGKRIEFKLPDIGEGVAEGEITSWKVKPGDVLKEDQVMVEVMTDKATVEIGSPVHGTVLELRAKEGQSVPVGAVIIVLEERVDSGTVSAPTARPAPASAAPTAARPAAPAAPPAASHTPAPAGAPAAAARKAAPAAVPAAAGEREEINFALPDIGEGVAEGEVTKWMVKAGDKVLEDQPIVEVMTDKATVEIGSPVNGEVLQLLVKEGQTVPVGAILLVLGAAAGAGKHVPAPHGAASRAAPVAAELQFEDEPEAGRAPELVGAGVASSAIALADTGLPARSDGSRRVRAAPATRRFAREAGLDVSLLNGSGPDGRILMDDVRAALTAARRPATPPAPRTAAPVASAPRVTAPVAAPRPHTLTGDERVPLRGLRKRIAAQMRLARQTAAHFTYVEEIDVTELVKLRAAAKARAATAGVKLTYMPFIIKAVVVGLRDFPLLNSSLDEAAGELVMHHDLNIGVAVDTPAGLIVPVLRNADARSMNDLARELTELADRARAGKTRPADVGGGTFTITNAGNIGGLLATPIINVPEVAIMGVHAIRRRPWVVADEIVIRDIMLLSISLDHRVVDGAVGAYFMNRVKELLENPGLMLFEPA